MEEELDKTRSKMKSMVELKREVIKVWNRIPKNLLAKVVVRFKTLLEKVIKNEGHKESRRCRRDKKPNIKLSEFEKPKDYKNNEEEPEKKGKNFKNIHFPEYPDTIERIAYSQKTLLIIKHIYKKFIDKEIAFMKKIKSHLVKYQNENNSSKRRTIHKNNETMKFVNKNQLFMDQIIEVKTTLQKKIDSMEDNEFWNLFPAQLKENFITTESLSSKENKIENIIINNDTSKRLWEIVNKVKMKDEFDEKDKDIKAFYDLMRSTFNKSESETVISILNKTDAETYNDNDQSEDNEFMEAPLLNKKRKRENPANDANNINNNTTNNIVNNLNQVIAEEDMIIDTNDELTKLTKELKTIKDKKNKFINSSLPEEAIVNVPYQSIVSTNIDIQATTPEDYVMCLLSELKKNCTKMQLWERSKIQNYNIIKSKPHLEGIIEKLRLQRKVIISAEFVLINEDLLLQET